MQLYVLQQRRALNEIEKDISIFFNPNQYNWVVDENGEVTVTIFSAFGLDLLANLLKPDRTISPQIEQYQWPLLIKYGKTIFLIRGLLSIRKRRAKISINGQKNSPIKRNK
ncbi:MULTISPECIES: hypothetical protein [unclassified Sporolactobacillus]|uniref:hypothetical protein n=1 Tax=unclassified Sporolactobacillus TaxID=2628533 RepID=UPI002367E411|nr:hypothetical protein [Sporolactobacillus sp. CQH2019]MDD9150214.1 hypothetical protein [Sporolactobacillus sp. CQH2019]